MCQQGKGYNNFYNTAGDIYYQNLVNFDSTAERDVLQCMGDEGQQQKRKYRGGKRGQKQLEQRIAAGLIDPATFAYAPKGEAEHARRQAAAARAVVEGLSVDAPELPTRPTY